MTDERLAEIKAQLEEILRLADNWLDEYAAKTVDRGPVDELFAEVERLRAENAELRKRKRNPPTWVASRLVR